MNQRGAIPAILLVCVTMFGVRAYSDTIGIITTKNMPYNEDVVNGIKDGLKRIAPEVSVETIYADDVDPVGVAQSKKYKAVCVLGSTSAKIVAAISDIPVIFSMIPKTSTGKLAEQLQKIDTNITGVFLSVDPLQQIEIAKKVLPSLKTVYLLHDGVSRDIYDQMKRNSLGITIVADKVDDPARVPAAIAAMGLKSMDVFWMLPDPNVYNLDSLAFILNYSLDKRVPIIGFAVNTVKAGALFGYVYDYADIGEQTADIIAKIITGTTPREIPPQYARKIGYALNLKIAANFDIKISSSVIKEAIEVVR